VLKKESSISLKEMREIMAQRAGSKFPVRITTREGEELIRYVRGFADAEGEMVLLSETSYSMSMKIMEIKDIAILEFSEGDDAPWVKYTAKWNRNKGFFFGMLGL
jgi:hypothetical protein